MVLVFGKFLPFHQGHKALIDFARQFGKVEAAIYGRTLEPWSIPQRVSWIANECPDVRVTGYLIDFCDPWDEESWKYWTETLRRNHPEVTHLVTSEAYGEECARRLGWKHSLFDLSRDVVPVSGTQIRACPGAHWDQLPDSVKPDLVRKVAFVGAESTGKTTLALQLAERYQTAWAVEYGREYCETVPALELTEQDLVNIAQGQILEENKKAIASRGLLFCDTDILVTRAWCQFLFKHEVPEVTAIHEASRYDLRAVTSRRVTWVQDGVRVCEEDAVRDEFYRYMQEVIEAESLPYTQLPARLGDAENLTANLVDTLWPEFRI